MGPYTKVIEMDRIKEYRSRRAFNQTKVALKADDPEIAALHDDLTVRYVKNAAIELRGEEDGSDSHGDRDGED